MLLLAIFAAMFLAIRSAQRLMRPVRDLIEGTRAVGKGDFTMRLQLPARDEMGWLVHSFNDMTRRLRRASEEASRSRAQVEEERERLAVILAGLSTGVIVLDTARRLRLANAAADAILGAHLAQGTGLELRELHELHEQSPQTAGCSRAKSARGSMPKAPNGRTSSTLPPDRVLRCACAQLVDPPASRPATCWCSTTSRTCCTRSATRPGAKWRAGSRTRSRIRSRPSSWPPSALRRRLAGKLDGEDAEVLERATHTIVQQVESLKGMVNAFSEYARAPDLKLAPLDLERTHAGSGRAAPRRGHRAPPSTCTCRSGAAARAWPTAAACARCSTTS